MKVDGKALHMCPRPRMIMSLLRVEAWKGVPAIKGSNSPASKQQEEVFHGKVLQ